MMLGELLRGLETPSAAEAFVAAHGREFRPVRRPKGIRRRTSGTCFKSAGLIALDNRSLFYVEGYAIRPGERSPIHHAWLTADGLTAIDPISKDATRGSYFGIVFSKRAAAEILLARRYHGILDPVDDLVTSAIARHPWRDPVAS